MERWLTGIAHEGPTDCALFIRDTLSLKQRVFKIDSISWKVLSYGNPTQETLETLLEMDENKGDSL